MAEATTKFAKAQLDLREPVKDKKHFKPGSSLKVVKFDFNPKEYSTGLQAGWNAKPMKKPGEYPEFTGTQLRTLDVEMFLDATNDDNGDVTPTIDALFSTVKATEKSIGAGTPFPPIVVFSWGSAKPFVAVVKSVTSSLTLFRPSGQPVRATCKVSMQEYPTDPSKQNPSSGSVSSTRAHRVVLGDSLASIANTEYGAPTMWRAIATVNGLEDPFNLRLGRELLIPPPADAAVLA
jgi:nucleoid-associated protein YgaU